MASVHVIGVGMTAFTKPGDPEAPDYPVAAGQAIKQALSEANLDFGAVQQAWTGYVYGDSCCGHRAIYEVGRTGIPIFNVNSNCSTGSSALFAARQAVESGAVDVALALGFEKMEKGALMSRWTDRTNPMELHAGTMMRLQEFKAAPPAAQMFGGAGQEYMDRHGAKQETFARIQVKARQHAANNAKALFRDPLTVEEILASPPQYGPLTRLMCCPPTCGAAAAILCSGDYARKQGFSNTVKIIGQAMDTDHPDSFADSMMDMVGYKMAERASQQAYDNAGVAPQDIDVVELHDCFTTNELISYESLGLTPQGTAERFITDGDNTYGGRVVVNPSGGLLSKGHPLGATGLAQCYELVNQLRGSAGERQVEGARLGLQHNIGLGGACVVTLYQHG